MDKLQCSQGGVGSAGYYEIKLWMPKIGTWVTNVPDLSELLIITRRYIEAEISKNAFYELQKVLNAKLLNKLKDRLVQIRL